MQEAPDLKADKTKVASIPWRGRQENQEIKVFLGYTVSSKPRLYAAMAQKKKRDRQTEHTMKP